MYISMEQMVFANQIPFQRPPHAPKLNFPYKLSKKEFDQNFHVLTSSNQFCTPLNIASILTTDSFVIFCQKKFPMENIQSSSRRFFSFSRNCP